MIRLHLIDFSIRSSPSEAWQISSRTERPVPLLGESISWIDALWFFSLSMRPFK
jgi:hypothetical protein